MRREVEEEVSVDAKHDREVMVITRESIERLRQMSEGETMRERREMSYERMMSNAS